LWATLWALFFIYIGAAYAQDLAAVPPWVAVVFQHSAFVGTMTNLLLGVYAARTQDVGNVLQGSETAALWLINLGLPLFFALEIAAGSRLGAIVMGSGVLLGVATMIVRLLLSDTRWAYELLYRWRAPWEVDGPRPELVEMVQSGRLKPCRAIDLGCGTGENVIFLAQNGFDVLGVDLSARAIAQAKAKAEAAGVTASFLTADVTTLANGVEPFDLLLDYGCLGCVMGQPARERYAQTVARLARPGATYILLAFARDSKRHFSAIPNTLTTAEVQSLFGGRFQIEHYDARHETGPLGISVALRLMRRRETIMSE
jgi:SAM-dependent methyltransferase